MQVVGVQVGQLVDLLGPFSGRSPPKKCLVPKRGSPFWARETPAFANYALQFTATDKEHKFPDAKVAVEQKFTWATAWTP